MKCSSCTNTHNLYILRQTSSRCWYICKDCNTAKQRRYRQTDKGKKAAIRATRKYNQANRVRYSAWSLARKLSTDNCEICGISKTDKHHPDPTKPLNIVYLCRLHHKQIHKQINIV